MPNKNTNIANILTGEGITKIKLYSADLITTKKGIIYVKKSNEKKK